MDLRDQLGNHLGSAYAIERELGGGGMARVFLAEEVRFHRRVVIKALAALHDGELNPARFAREIQLAATLQQANIVPLLAAGEVDGIPYFIMPYVDGESLQQRLAAGSLPVREAVSILRDVCRGLAYAHARGVIHRDIKPGNVLLSGGTAVVTDFGIAKALVAARDDTASVTLTGTGISLGTPAYMAPEQAVGDPGINQRVDLYSLGILAYELLTGSPPFRNRTAPQLVAAHLTEIPAPVVTQRAECPPALSHLVSQLLEKNPERRPASAAAVLAELEAIERVGEPAAAPLSPLRAFAIYGIAALLVIAIARTATSVIGLPDWVTPGAVILIAAGLPPFLITAYAQRVRTDVARATPPDPLGRMLATLSWRRTARSGAIAFSAFVLLVVGFMVTRAAGIGPAATLFTAGRLAPDDRIVLADLNPTAPADSALAAGVGDAVRSSLDQSSIRIVAPVEIAEALERMRRTRVDRLDLALARDLAQRIGAKAVLTGTIVQVGSSRLVTLELLNARDGVQLTSTQASIERAGDVQTAADAMVRRMRAKIGESLRDVQHSVPLARATTASLNALTLFSDAVRAYDINTEYERADTLLRRAVAIDSTFALAWRKLGMALLFEGASTESRDSAFSRGKQFADRLPESEKQLVLGAYYDNGRTDADAARAFEAYQAAYAADSFSFVAANHMMIGYGQRQLDDSSVRYALRAYYLQQTPRMAMFAAVRLAMAGRVSDAGRFLDSLARTNPGVRNDPTLLEAGAWLSYARGLPDSAHAVMEQMLQSPVLSVRDDGRNLLANEARLHGQLRRADTLDDTNIRRKGIFSHEGRIIEVLQTAGDDIHYRLQPAAARLSLTNLVKFLDADSTTTGNDYFRVAALFAQADDVPRAKQVMAKARGDLGSSQAHITLGEIAFAKGDYTTAMDEFKRADRDSTGKYTGCRPCTLFNFARVTEKVAGGDSAIAAYERYLAVPAAARMGFDMTALPLVEKELGDLYSARGDVKRALLHYSTLVDLWAKADPELQPSVAAMRTRIAELVRREGG